MDIPSEYTRGYDNAVKDISARGIEWAVSMSGPAFCDGMFGVGYRTAIGVAQERLAR